ncbi:glycosyltransferase family 4 protein [Kitasatospora sp. NPDC056181]|uniref:glycosyltransferase family 4 protein n=1 Tax=Kitasatospora sp. NPDC056181 TaxID=3345737 RepID=UPI0035E3B232
MASTLVVTNDFPPRQGGIETFVHALATRLPAGEVVVYTSAEPGAAAYDAGLPFPVVRDRSRMLLPTRRVTRRAAEIARANDCDRVWFGAAAPLAAMTPGLRRQAPGIGRTVATTHGHEIWWARTPGARRLLRRIGDSVDVVTYLGEYTRARIAPALGPRARLERLVPGVDTGLFRPSGDGARAGGPVVLCVARLVPRKGQDVLIRALPLIRRAAPGTVLVLVGRGPDERRLRALARQHTEPGSVVFAGGREHAATAAHYAAADVFAMPCRTRRAGLEAEGLGIVFLEAAAAGLPVVAGRSGGAPDAVLDGVTGTVVDGRSPAVVASAVGRLLRAPAAERARTGAAGRRWVQQEWSWETSARRLAGLLDPDHREADHRDGEHREADRADGEHPGAGQPGADRADAERPAPDRTAAGAPYSPRR